MVVVNKGDLVSKKQKADIIGKIRLLNPNAKIVESIQSKVNVMEILNTHLFKAEDNKVEFWMKASKEAAELIDENGLECCEKSMAKDGKKCCKSKSKDGKLINSGLSQVGLMKHQPPVDSLTSDSAGCCCKHKQQGSQDNQTRDSVWNHFLHISSQEAFPSWPTA